MNKSGTTQKESKNQHEIQMLNYLRIYGATPRSDIAEQMGLAKAAVTLLTNDLISADILAEKGEVLSPKQKRGRRKVMIDINENCRLAFGVVIERDFLQVGLTNLKGQILDRQKNSLANLTYRDLLNLIVSSVQQMVKNNCVPPAKLLGAGICLSKSGEMHIEGTTAAEKLTRLKKDLSYALTFPLVAVPTAVGALAAQSLLIDTQAENLLLLRFGEETGCAILSNGQVNYGATRRAGGFERLIQGRCGGYDAFREEPGGKDGTNEALNQRLAEVISLCATVLDPEKIVTFGSYLETEAALPMVRGLMEQQLSSPPPIERSFVTEKTVFLSGCAAAIANLFYLLRV